MDLQITKCFIDGIECPGLLQINHKIFGDKRGFFCETYNQRDFFNAGLAMKFVQDNQSFSTKGVLRGLHFQTNHPQGKLVSVIQGSVYDVAVDLRNGSPTFGKHFAVVLDGVKKNQLYIPEGFAHGFYVLSENALSSYKCTDFYDPTGEDGIIWNDATIGINWQKVTGGTTPTLAEKDLHYKPFDFSKKYFEFKNK
ncbi:MAG: dTDP-4-dehydrorhamnose 3,5-epimerase [Spirochaetia bacterium]|nr:dTDP-4-dehydrorhamnose 3,5-epimerase [Spirochaetia bacterium]